MTHPSEDTLTTILKEILVEEGINVEAFPVWDTPVGLRKPDLLIRTTKLYDYKNLMGKLFSNNP